MRYVRLFHASDPSFSTPTMSSQLLETAATHPFSLVGLADSVWNAVSERAIRASWGPVTRVAESAVLSCVGLFTLAG